MAICRRRFVRLTLNSTAAVLVGCVTEDVGNGSSGTDAGGADGFGADTDPLANSVFARGQLLEEVPFTDQFDVLFERPFDSGLDGRLNTDLSKIDPGVQAIPNELFYIRTRVPGNLDSTDGWSIDVNGLVETPTTLTMADLEPLVRSKGNYVMECSGNGPQAAFGLMSAADWSGVYIREVLEMVSPMSSATHILISGNDDHTVTSTHSDRGASWVFDINQLEQAGAFLATRMNGEPLPVDHGSPVRLYVPNWYGCTCIKWVDVIHLTDNREVATSQMQEFASRTHQDGVPAMAADYQMATMDQSAMPIRVEKWRVDGRIIYKLIGIMWGGYRVTDGLTISYQLASPELVDVSPPQSNNLSWTVWTHAWEPTSRGEYVIQNFIDDEAVPTRRLNTGYYARTVFVDEVT
jgi:DMSO/TMAO reductase YedYZ molybdopterin-dependent catalytic subunit